MISCAESGGSSEAHECMGAVGEMTRSSDWSDTDRAKSLFFAEFLQT